MATKRMFSNSVIDSDEFCMLSIEAQLLYFHLGMKADDDGFVPVMKICKILGFDEAPLQELESQKFLIRFDGGVEVIVHWKVNNTFKNDRYHASRYTSFKKRLKTNENNEYVLMEPNWNQDGTKTEESIAQSSVAQSSILKPSVTQRSAEEGSPEGGNNPQQLFDLVERDGIKLTDRVKNILLEECNKTNETDIISRFMCDSAFHQRLKMLSVE